MTPWSVGTSDEKLIQAARVGDREAFDALMQRHFGLVYTIALARLGEREAAEDLVQEVFLRAYLFLDRLEAPAKFPIWLGCIARNLATSWRRSDQSAPRLVPLLTRDNAPMEIPDESLISARDQMENVQRHDAVHEALRRLPPPQREVVLLHYMEGLTHREIAQRLGFHHSTVTRHLQGALKRLAGLLEPMVREGVKELRPRPLARARTLGVVAAAAGLSATAKASLAASAGSSAQMAAASPLVGGAGGLMGSLIGGIQSLFAPLITFFTTGGKVMILCKSLAALSIAVTLSVTLASKPSPVRADGLIFGDPWPIATFLDHDPPVIAADLDGDGDLDAITAYTGRSVYIEGGAYVEGGNRQHGSSKLTWYENDGSVPPRFIGHVIEEDLPEGSSRNGSISAADVNHDGHVDLIAQLPTPPGTQIGGRFAWYENDGAKPPRFILHPLAPAYTTIERPSVFDAADLNGDGHLDLLAGFVSSHSIVWYASDGASTPGFTSRIILGGRASRPRRYGNESGSANGGSGWRRRHGRAGRIFD